LEKVMRKLIVRRRDGVNETLSLLGEQFTVLAAGEETGSYEVFVQVVPPGAGPPLHSHDWDEAFYVLDGELAFRTDEQQVQAPLGTFVHVPAGTPHAFASRGGTATLLCQRRVPRRRGAVFRDSRQTRRSRARVSEDLGSCESWQRRLAPYLKSMI
jgi:quercetin dioxygenase-like cupin family protein